MNSTLSNTTGTEVTISGRYTSRNTDVAIDSDDWHIPYIAPINATAGLHTQITLYHQDLLGSPVAATNEAGVVSWVKEYGPYGQIIAAASDDELNGNHNRIGYTGHVEGRRFWVGVYAAALAG